jgi:hypothetical protein
MCEIRDIIIDGADDYLSSREELIQERIVSDVLPLHGCYDWTGVARNPCKWSVGGTDHLQADTLVVKVRSRLHCVCVGLRRCG